MSELGDAFKKVMKNEIFSEKLLIPILIWLSGYKDNIEVCQNINKRLFYKTNRNIYIREDTIYNI